MLLLSDFLFNRCETYNDQLRAAIQVFILRGAFEAERLCGAFVKSLAIISAMLRFLGTGSQSCFHRMECVSKGRKLPLTYCRSISNTLVS